LTASITIDSANFNVVRWFGAHGKIFHVHFRSINIRRDDCMEVHADVLSVQMARSSFKIDRTNRTLVRAG
jgi:hypothetical protein